MRAIINQKANPPGLPELRNLGTLLRILLAVNGAAVVTEAELNAALAEADDEGVESGGGSNKQEAAAA